MSTPTTDDLSAQLNAAIERALIQGTQTMFPPCTNVGRDYEPKALTINEMLAAILGALTGRDWKVTEHVQNDDAAYRLGAIYICSPAFAQKLIAAVTS